MIGYYKNHIYALSQAILSLQSSPERVAQLKELQKRLARRILNSERKIDELKCHSTTLRRELRTSRPSKEKAKGLKKKVKFLQKRINEHKWMLFVWRCFGDAVVFLYLDKFAVKPFLYEFGTSEPKQTAGRLAGKAGLSAELSVAFDAIENDVPAILCDLTNCIRHGDICLLGESDPVVIEVKSSLNTNVRVNRQTEAISGLHQYLESDQSSTLFGVPHLERMEIGVSEVNYQTSIAPLIDRAQEEGCGHLSPEKGLHYLALCEDNAHDLEKLMPSLDQPLVFFLNETKNGGAWGSYYPFVLSIGQAHHLYAFLKGDVYIIVMIEIGVCKALAQEKGWDLSYRESGDYALEFTESGDQEEPFKFNLSRHFLGRIAHEFLSLQWVMDFQEHQTRELKRRIAEAGNA